jgi:MOSC domain-containing protein YiiM
VTDAYGWRVNASILSVNRGLPTAAPWAGDKGVTGIDKRPVDGPVRVHRYGFDGDRVLDTRVHGGIDQALYAYSREDADWWAAELGRELKPGNFGENLTTAGIDLTESIIGERWTVGTSLVEVSCSRQPCRVFAGFWQVPDLIKRFTARALPGAYLRVLTEGEIAAGDRIEVVHRPDHGLTIGILFRALTLEPELLPHLVDVIELPEKYREVARRRVSGAVAPT